LSPWSARAAWSQANSDFYAYPKSLTDYNTFLAASKNVRQLTFNRMPGLSPDYQVGPGDELEITIIGMIDKPQAMKLSGSGEISIPYIGTMALGGLTAEQVETAIADRLREKQLMSDPQVLVYISAYEAKTVYALGEVDRPGEYSVSFDMTLMDLIFVAGGVDFTAARYGYLHRRIGNAPPEWKPMFARTDMNELQNRPNVARPGSEVIEIDLQPMKEGGVLERNITLRNGDVLYVPRRKIEVVYVIGDVFRAGAFELPEERRLTALGAISWAGGPTKTAKMSKGMLVRYEPGGKRLEYPVDFAAILEGRKADVEVRPDDIIFVPGSGGKTLAYGLLNTIPGIVGTALVF
jgi:polysaccharide export outer membrane protein